MRFSPTHVLKGGRQRCLPSAYGAATIEAALFETVFHDSADTESDFFVYAADLQRRIALLLEPLRDLRLVDLTDTALTGYGVTRGSVVDTSPTQYDVTRQWGQRVAELGRWDGIVWQSRRALPTLSMMLFLATKGYPAPVKDSHLAQRGGPLTLHEGSGLRLVESIVTKIPNAVLVLPTR